MENALLIKISKIISNLFNPFTSLFLFLIYYCFNHYTLENAVLNISAIFLIIILPVLIWIYYNVKTGKYSNADVSNREQRKSLYTFIDLCLVVYLLINYYYLDKNLEIIFIFLLLLLVLMQISNYFIKSSMHVALNLFTASLFLTENITIGIFWFFITILVGISRIVLKRHTLKEVFMGAFIGSLVSILYLYVYIQNYQ